MASCIQNLAFDDIVVSTGTLSQADSGTATTKCKGRQPRSRNKKTLQREAAIAGAMQAGGTQAQRDEALQALQAALQGQDGSTQAQDDVGVTQGKKRGGQLAQRIRFQERRSDRNGLSGALRL
jgi:hypothetical protein